MADVPTIKTTKGGAVILDGTVTVDGRRFAVLSGCPEVCCGGKIVIDFTSHTCARYCGDAWDGFSFKAAVSFADAAGEYKTELVTFAFDSCRDDGATQTARFVGKSVLMCEAHLVCGDAFSVSTPSGCEEMEVVAGRFEAGTLVSRMAFLGACLLTLFDRLLDNSSTFASGLREIVDNFVAGTPYPGDLTEVLDHVPQNCQRQITDYFDSFFAGHPDFWHGFMVYVQIRIDSGYYAAVRGEMSDEELYDAIEEFIPDLMQPENLMLLCELLSRPQYLSRADVETAGYFGKLVLLQKRNTETAAAQLVVRKKETQTKEVCNGEVRDPPGAPVPEGGWDKPITGTPQGSFRVDDCGALVAYLPIIEEWGETASVHVRVNADMQDCCGYNAESVFVAIVEGYDPDGRHLALTCLHGGESPLWGDMTVVGTFPNYVVSETCCAVGEHHPTLSIKNADGTTWDGATLTLSGGVVEVTPKVPVSISIYAKHGDGTPATQDECNEIPDTLTATARGVSIALVLDGNVYSGHGYVPCQAGDLDISVSGGDAVWHSGPTVEDVACYRERGYIATGSAVPHKRMFHLQILFDCSDAVPCTNHSATVWPRLVLHADNVVPSISLSIDALYEDDSCAKDPSIEVDGHREYESCMAELIRSPEFPYLMLASEAAGDNNGYPDATDWDPATETLTLVWKAVCDPSEFGTIRVKLNGGEAAYSDGRVEDGYYILVARIGDSIYEPTWSRECWSPSYVGGASWPATMPGGTTVLELQWTATVSIDVTFDDTCTEPSHSYDGERAYEHGVTVDFCQDALAAVPTGVLPGDVCGNAVSFSRSRTGWSFSGSVTDRTGGLAWKFVPAWQTLVNARTASSHGNPGNRNYINYHASLETLRGSLACENNALSASGTTRLAWSDPWLSAYDDGGD